jgi:hypothetical protein
MKKTTTFLPVQKAGEPNKTRKNPESAGTAGRWSAVQHVRLPHKVGLPLSSGGGGDGAGE